MYLITYFIKTMENISKSQIVDTFCIKVLNDKKYYRHSDIDFTVNLKITGIMNYFHLLEDEEEEFISKNYEKNLSYLKEIDLNKNNINEEKIKIKEMSKKKTKNQDSEIESNLLYFKFPEFEVYFTIKLVVDGHIIEPEAITDLVLTSEFCESISIRYKYKDLTLNSVLAINLYSMQLIKEKSLLGGTTINLFDENFNLLQGRHIFNLYRKEEANFMPKSKTPGRIENMDFKELDKIVNSFNFDYTNKINSKTNNSDPNTHFKGTTLNPDIKKQEKDKEFNTDFYHYHYNNKINSLLSKFNNSFVEVCFPNFKFPVIYEEDINPISKQFYKPSKSNSFIKSNCWVHDLELSKMKNFLSKDNPITEKFSILSRISDDAFARDIKPNPHENEIIDELITKPDFIKVEDREIILLWKYRYHLINRKCCLTKILNAVKWGDLKSEIEFLNNILSKWTDVEIGDILYMLSFRFCMNPNYEKNIFPKMIEVRKKAVKHLENISSTDLNFILLQLVQALRYEDETITPLKDFLINKCKNDIILATSLYWFLSVEADDSQNGSAKNKSQVEEMTRVYKTILKQFNDALPIEIAEDIEGQKILRNMLIKNANELSKYKYEIKKKKLPEIISKGGVNEMYKLTTPLQLPLDPNIKINGLKPSECRVFLSAKFPSKYTFTVTNESQIYVKQDDPSLFDLMFKFGDDLRQDQLILQIISYMDNLLKRVNLDFEFTTYKVLATSKNDGFVEFVPNSLTIYDILKNYQNQIYPFLRENGGNNTEKLLDSYINSCAGYCVATYILGIGDRHLENILINRNGKLFHIDFGYILGRDPKFYPPPMKLCEEMVNCMGGTNSPKYIEFKKKCNDAFSYLRQHSRLIVNMFYLMIHSGLTEIVDYEKTLNKLNEKFFPNLNAQKASNSLLNKLEESVSALYPILMEKFHHWAIYFKSNI